MPFNGSGTFTRLENWTNDANNGLPISATKFDIEDNDFAAGFGNCLTRDGQGKPTTSLNWGQTLAISVPSDTNVLALGRNSGTNNPALQFQVIDATGFTLNLTTAQQLAFATAGTPRMLISGAGDVTINIPASGPSLSVFGIATTGLASSAVFVQGSSTSGQSWGLYVAAGTTSADSAFRVQNATQSANYFGIRGDGSWFGGPAGGNFQISANGNILVANPTSGVPLSVGSTYVGSTLPSVGVNTATNTGNFYGSFDGTHEALFGTYNSGGFVGSFSAHLFDIRTSNTQRMSVAATGSVTINAPSSASNALLVNALANSNAISVVGAATTGQSFGLLVQAGTNASDFPVRVQNQGGTQFFFTISGSGVVTGNDGTNLLELGYKDLPQNLQNGNYTLALSDRGKSIVCTTGTNTYTIPANSSVNFPTGTTIAIYNNSSNNLTLAITTDTLNWLQGGSITTGNRTLAAGSAVTIYKVTATAWNVAGNGLS